MFINGSFFRLLNSGLKTVFKIITNNFGSKYFEKSLVLSAPPKFFLDAIFDESFHFGKILAHLRFIQNSSHVFGTDGARVAPSRIWRNFRCSSNLYPLEEVFYKECEFESLKDRIFLHKSGWDLLTQTRMGSFDTSWGGRGSSWTPAQFCITKLNFFDCLEK